MSLEQYQPSKQELISAEEMSKERKEELKKRNFNIALNDVCERHPDFLEKIKRSLETPQLGKYHNEGPKMDAHLTLILATLEEIKDGKFHDSIKDVDFQEMMRSVVLKQKGDNQEGSKINAELVDYTFFHDIAKPDCLTLKTDGDKSGIEVTWEQWKEIEQDGEPFKFEGKTIVSISYFHSSEGSSGQHGNKGASMLENKGVSPEIIIAISKHEVAYQFGKINTTTYEEHFVKTGFSEEQQKFILVASYIDTMASVGVDGKPNLDNFINLVKSRDNFLLIKKYVDNGTLFRESDLNALKKQDRVLTTEDVEKIILREEKYDLSILESKLDILVYNNQITPEEKEQIISIISSDPKELGKKFGSKMKIIKPLLDQSKV